MIYGCICYLTLIEKDGESELSREVDLPFPPFPGLALNFDKEDDDDLFVFDVQRVEYSVNGETFWLFQTHSFTDTGCPCGPEDDCCTIARLVAWYVEEGWKEESRRVGKDRLHRLPGMFDPDNCFLAELDRQYGRSDNESVEARHD